ncbi:hypothetical protein [Paenibacillus alginolyticus]|nr:hypothetical protein [Paenibacillus alginolyticus]MEC0143369.1 hypothetical protein [Paenibacillus alginolyticus]
MNKWWRIGITLFVSLLMPTLENLAERLGDFVHTDKWMHVYSVFGYFLFLMIISGAYFWLRKRSE